MWEHGGEAWLARQCAASGVRRGRAHARRHAVDDGSDALAVRLTEGGYTEDAAEGAHGGDAGTSVVRVLATSSAAPWLPTATRPTCPTLRAAGAPRAAGAGQRGAQRRRGVISGPESCARLFWVVNFRDISPLCRSILEA